MEQEVLGPTEVTIPFLCLVENDISANDYIVLFCKYHANCILPEVVANNLSDADWEHLQSRGFIKITADGYVLRQPAIDLFECDTPDVNWMEFLGKFPLKVPARNGGTRALKIANPDSKGNDRIRKKYISLINKDPNLHKHIIRVLEAEMEMRKNSNNLQYMHNMETWLNQADYDKYAYLLDEDGKADENSPSEYGNKMI